VYAEGQAPRKKDAEHQACLDACKQLELHGLFNRSRAAGRTAARKRQDDDYYSSDDDVYLDRTGDGMRGV
jgi:hypothetical protein